LRVGEAWTALHTS